MRQRRRQKVTEAQTNREGRKQPVCLVQKVQRYRTPQRFHGYGKAGKRYVVNLYFLTTHRVFCRSDRGLWGHSSRSVTAGLGSTLQDGLSPQWNHKEKIATKVRIAVKKTAKVSIFRAIQKALGTLLKHPPLLSKLAGVKVSWLEWCTSPPPGGAWTHAILSRVQRSRRGLWQTG